MKKIRLNLFLLAVSFVSCNMGTETNEKSPDEGESQSECLLEIEHYSHSDSGWQTQVISSEDNSWMVMSPEEEEYTFSENGVCYTYKFDHYEKDGIEINDDSWLTLDKHTKITAIWNKYKNVDDVLLSADGKQLIKCLGSKKGEYTIPAGVETIEQKAFSGCSDITVITIPEGVKTIKEFAFEELSNVVSVKLPSSIEDLEKYIFSYCKKLEEVEFGAGYAYEKIPSGMFSGCVALKTIALPSATSSIENNAFSDCSKLESFTIPENVTKLGNEAFFGCSGLTSLVIPQKCTSIGNSVFSGCKKIENIEIPSTVEEIGAKAFKDWTAEQTITLKGRGEITLDGEKSTPPPLDEWYYENTEGSTKHWWYEGCSAKIYADSDTTKDLRPKNSI